MITLALLISLSLAQAPSADLEKLEQVLELSGPNRAAAEQALRAEPRSAGQLLSLALRLNGASGAQEAFREKTSCTMLIMGGIRVEPGPAKAAAVLLLSLSATDAQVRTQLATSGSGLDKLVAIVSVWDDEEALETLAGQLEAPSLDEGERRLHMQLRQCSMMSMSMRKPGAASRTAALTKLSGGKKKAGSCEDEVGAKALLEGPPFQLRSWSSSNNEFSFQLEASGASTTANSACMFALYPGLQARGDGSWALVPLIENHTPEGAGALALLQRDLELYPKDARRRALRLVLSRGLMLEKLAEFNENERRNDPLLLRAWLLTKAPAAQAALLSRLGCPFGGDEVGDLLVLEDRKVALAEAQRLAALCPRSRGAAMGALRELKDTKWLKHAALVLEDPFARSDFEKALNASWSKAIKEQLLAVQSRDEAFLKWRAEFVQSADRSAPK